MPLLLIPLIVILPVAAVIVKTVLLPAVDDEVVSPVELIDIAEVR
jgi:hypothetical protein